MKLSTLSKAEMNVAELIAQGYSDKKIEQELSLSYNTIKTHVRSIYNKLGLWGIGEQYNPRTLLARKIWEEEHVSV